MSKMFSIQRSREALPDGEYNALINSVRAKNDKIVVDFIVNEKTIISKFYDINFSPYTPLWYLFCAVNEDFEGDFEFEEFREMMMDKELNVDVENVVVDGVEYCNVTKTYSFELLQ